MNTKKFKTGEIRKILKKQQQSEHFIVFITILLLVTLIGLPTLYYIHTKALERKTQKEIAKEHAAIEKTIKQAQKPVLKPWYTYRGVAHALGGVDGKDYLNSIDGFYQAYSKGYRIFEMDLLLTTDQVAIGKHKWGWNLADPTSKKGNAVSYQTFKSTKIYGKYTPTSLLDMFQVMDKYPDFYLMTDSKGDEIADVRSDFNVIVETARKANKEYLLDRLIVQVYNQQMFQTIKEIYPFKHFVYTTYKQPDAAFYEMVRFCLANHIEGVTSPQNDINDYRMDILKEKGLYSFTHSINSSYHTKEFMKLGVYGVYSDFLTPAQIDLSYIRANYPTFIIRFMKELIPTYRNL